MTLPTELLFYDGHCGLCHYAVKFILRQDRSGTAFRFAPLHGETFQARVPVPQRMGLPDSMVVQAHNGSLLLRSEAWIHVLRRLGGGWKIVAALLEAIPQPLRDGFYKIVARTRYLMFGRRKDACPLVAPNLRARFDP